MQVVTKGAATDIRQALLDTHSLSDRQVLFVTAFMQGASKSEAAIVAGYDSAQAGMAAWRSKKVQAAIALMVDRFLVGEAAPAALRALYQIVNDESGRVAGGVRVAAAVAILDRAGFNAKRHQGGEAELDIGAMSAAELRQALARIDAELTGRMVDVTPDSEPMTSQELDTYS